MSGTAAGRHSPHRRGPRGERGAALLLVLGCLMVLSLIAAALIRGSASDWQAARNGAAAVEARALADAGIATAIHLLLTRPADRPVPIDGTPFRIEHDGQPIEIRIQDQYGLLDINAIGGDVLRQVLARLGLSGADLDRLADAIEDWRDADDLRRLNGAEAKEYREAGRVALPRNGAFESVDEIDEVLGMTPEMAARLKPILTVYAQRPFVDLAVAPRDVLGVVLGSDGEERRAVLDRKAQGPPITVQSLPELTGRVFIIRILTAGRLGGSSLRKVVIRITGDRLWPYLIQSTNIPGQFATTSRPQSQEDYLLSNLKHLFISHTHSLKQKDHQSANFEILAIFIYIIRKSLVASASADPLAYRNF